MALRRLSKDLRTINKGDIPGITAAPVITKKVGSNGEIVESRNMYHWLATIEGPADTPYEGGTFQLDIRFPSTYPFKPPTVKFITKVYHPNVSDAGDICVSILKTGWSPLLDTAKVLLSLSSLLSDPNPDDPLNSAVTNVYRASPELFLKNARDWTKTYATNN